MFLKSIVLKATFYAATGMLLMACGSETIKEETVTAPVEDSISASEEAPEVYYSLPSPLQIASIFKKSGLKYKEGITSSFKDPARYTTNLSKTINLGIYSADLSYAVLNKQNQEAMTYMKLAHTLANSLGIGAVFEQGNLLNRFEKNLGNEDSLTYIIAELQMVTDMYLDENGQQQITSIVFAGAWIESMYIGSKVFEKEKNKSLNSKVTEQMPILENIVNALKSQEKKDSSISSLIDDLEKLESFYNALPSIRKARAEDNPEKELIITDHDVTTLTKKIEELRTKFIIG